jgi:branched-chain amino acid transport system ATP-binding protein
VTRLEKAFGGLQALVDVNFSIIKGSITGIVGPNGAGKTTLINAMSGFLRCDKGTIIYKDREIHDFKPHLLTKVGISRSFQLASLFPKLSVGDCIVLPLFALPKKKHINQRGLVQKRDQLLEKVGLLEKADEVVENLTQSEIKSLDIMRAVAVEPELLLVDEPFSGLGVSEIKPLIDLFFELNRAGMTIIVVEHKLRELLKFIEYLIVLNFGVVISQGRPMEVLNDATVIESYLGKRGGAEKIASSGD